MIKLGYKTYQKRPTSQGIQWPVPGSRSLYSVGDEAIPVVEAPSRDWDRARGPGGKRPLQLRTSSCVSC